MPVAGKTFRAIVSESELLGAALFYGNKKQKGKKPSLLFPTYTIVAMFGLQLASTAIHANYAQVIKILPTNFLPDRRVKQNTSTAASFAAINYL